MTAEVIHGDCREVLAGMEERSVHAIVTDPPYGLKFMGKAWDHGVPGVEFWQAVLRVARPGAPLLAFGGTRTAHRLVCAIEDAGWEIRDSVAWIHAEGMPKTSVVDGYGQDLKPCLEWIVLARCPLDGTVAENASRWGVGGLWIEGTRVEGTVTTNPKVRNARGFGRGTGLVQGETGRDVVSEGRHPANVVLDEQCADLLDAEVGDLISGANPTSRASDKFRKVYGEFAGQRECLPKRGAERGGPSRFYYCAKPSTSERGEYNTHATVKPLSLMQWLVRLVKPPRGGVILDPFAGSGTTGIAATREGLDFIGIELEADHVNIARRRIYDDAPLFNAVGGAA